MVRKEIVVAQSSDENESNTNNESGSFEAEQILDSIIEHIESTDEPVIEDEPSPSVSSSTDAYVSSSGADDRHQTKSKVLGTVGNVGVNSDIKSIERRAAELASRLGGEGLSYSAGVKKHLESNPASAAETIESVVVVATASIHDDDLDAGSERFGISPLNQTNMDEQVNTELDRQKTHINKWDAELQDGSAIELITSDAEVIEVDLSPPSTPDKYTHGLEEEPVDLLVERSHAEENISELESLREENPDLHDIENKIEALSSTMNASNVDPAEDQFGEPDNLSIKTSLPSVESLGEMEQRVGSLEKHIVELLDDVSLSEQKKSDAVTDIVRSETQKLVHEAIETTELFGVMKAELANAAEQRRLQDVHMSDSLDALHDALKDIGERVTAIEIVEISERQVIEQPSSHGGGIVSSVLGGALMSEDTTVDSQLLKPPSRDEVSDSVARNTDTQLPTWLSDSTQDLHSEESDMPDETADVFASSAGLGEPALDESAIQEKTGLVGHADASLDIAVSDSSTDAQGYVLVDDANSDIHRSLEIADVGKSVAENKPRNVETDADLSPQSQNEENDDFLRSARGAARAANERVRVSELESDKVSISDKIKQNTGNFIAAAKQKDSPVEAVNLVRDKKETAKKSLFSDKVEGPNSLLVFTSLILFGTSALLLYGMSRSDVETGSVVKLNAIEKLTDQGAANSNLISGKNDQNKLLEKIKAKRGFGDKRSKLQKSVAVAQVGSIATKDDSDTLSHADRSPNSHEDEFIPVPSSVEYTGALPGTNPNVDTGSLFDQYISFSTPSRSPAGAGKASLQKRGLNGLVPPQGDSVDLLVSASNGDALAQYEVARRYGKGMGVQKSAAISVEWYEKSARAGYAPAIYRLATMYERGNGVRKDYKHAMKLYISAADKGNVKAMHNLAVLYTGGNLGKTDYLNAINWYEKAAHFGVKDSQFNLAIIYQNGMGGQHNIEKAYKWYSLAALAGDNEAKDMLKELRQELSGVQQKQLEQNIRSWKAKTPDRNANVVPQYSKASLTSGGSNKS